MRTRKSRDKEGGRRIYLANPRQKILSTLTRESRGVNLPTPLSELATSKSGIAPGAASCRETTTSGIRRG